jgi:transcriptional regulator GlxA family with amidase domain
MISLLIEAADRYLAECFAAATPPHVNEFAARLGMTPRTLNRSFRSEASVSVGAYFRNARIAHAKELLATTELSVASIAEAAGFGTRTSIYRVFRRILGMTPEEYRLQCASRD